MNSERAVELVRLMAAMPQPDALSSAEVLQILRDQAVDIVQDTSN